jgi:beta-mannosidase
MQSENVFNLDGMWRLRWSDGQRGGLWHHHGQVTDSAKWLDATVPGEVHLDLLRAGLISEPTLGTNVLAARWVEESFWSYRRSFVAPQSALTGRSWLRFEELDYGATIFLNEERIGTHANVFRPCEIEVTKILKPGDNLVVVQLDSGLHAVADKPFAGFYHGSEDGRLYKRMWLRKPQFTFSWDWAPRLVNIGIGGSVTLTWAEKAKVDSTALHVILSSDLSQGKLIAKFHLQALLDREILGEIMMDIEETGDHFSQPIVLAPGAQVAQIEASMMHPELWWPVGQGRPFRYTVRMAVVVEGEIIGSETKRVGFRHVRVNQSKEADGGQRFVLEVNGRPIFAKGANWVPADIILARVDAERYRTLIARALELNFNFLRIWGGGIYERDEFYELCDAAGILVWQEFIFACASYPTTDAEFLDNVTQEARHQIRRLAHRPSLIAWCGNNEIEWLTWDQPTGEVRPDHAWFHQTLPRILAEEDPSRYYQPSSPLSPDNTFPNADDRGDQHPWSVGFGNVDFRDYRSMTCRFPNEGGILGPSSLPTIETALASCSTTMHSFAWELHDNSIEDSSAESPIDRLVQEWVGKDPRQLSLEEYVFYGGLVQGEGLREYIDNFRRRKFDSASAIFWMYNDCWPTTRSWTVVDYYLRRTPSFYPVRRAFAPISVVVSREQQTVKIYGINDTPTSWTGLLQYGLFTLEGGRPFTQEAEVEVPPNQSRELVAFSADSWDQLGETRAVAYAMLLEGPQLIARNRLILPRFKELEWSGAQVEVSREGEYAVFSSHTFAWGVCLDLDGIEIGDNFFDVWPQIPYRIPWPIDAPLPSIHFLGNLLGSEGS